MRLLDLYARSPPNHDFYLILVSEKHAQSKMKVHHDLCGSLPNDQASQTCRSHSTPVLPIVAARYDLGHIMTLHSTVRFVMVGIPA